MTSAQFKRWLARQGCTFELGKGEPYLRSPDGRISVMPMHGSNRELSTGTVFKIKKDLGLTQK